MSTRRKETTVKTETVVTRSKRVEFKPADLRRLLRLPADAELSAFDPDGQAVSPLGDLGLVATYTKTTTRGGK